MSTTPSGMMSKPYGSVEIFVVKIFEVYKHLSLYFTKNTGSTKQETVDIYLTYHYINLRYVTI